MLNFFFYRTTVTEERNQTFERLKHPTVTDEKDVDFLESFPGQVNPVCFGPTNKSLLCYEGVYPVSLLP